MGVPDSRGRYPAEASPQGGWNRTPLGWAGEVDAVARAVTVVGVVRAALSPKPDVVGLPPVAAPAPIDGAALVPMRQVAPHPGRDGPPGIGRRHHLALGQGGHLHLPRAQQLLQHPGAHRGPTPKGAAAGDP